MTKKPKKTDAADAQVEDLGREDAPGAAPGEGPSTESRTTAAGADEIAADAGGAPADNAGGADGRDDGAETAGEDAGGAAAEEEDIVDDGGLADELDDGQLDAPAIDAHDDTGEHRHIPADYEVDAPFAPGDRVFLIGQPTTIGTVSEIQPKGLAGVTWDDREDSVQPFETIAALPAGGENADPEAGAAGVDLLALTAYAAAQSVFTPPEPEDWRFPEGMLECAAAFVRENPDVEAAVLPVQLKLKGFRPDVPVEARELAAWTVFRAALLALDTMRAAELAEAQAAAAGAEGPARVAVPRDRLSFVPHDQALSPTGFSPSR